MITLTSLQIPILKIKTFTTCRFLRRALLISQKTVGDLLNKLAASARGFLYGIPGLLKYRSRGSRLEKNIARKFPSYVLK
jgi:hypothetical protein